MVTFLQGVVLAFGGSTAWLGPPLTASKLVVASKEQLKPWVLDLTQAVLLVFLVLAVLGSLTPSAQEPTVTSNILFTLYISFYLRVFIGMLLTT